MARTSNLGLRSRLAIAAARAATWASRTAGRGAGGMIGGLVAMTIDPHLLRNLGTAQHRPTAIVTGTNGKSTTARLLTAATRALLPPGQDIAFNQGGDNMDAGIISTLLAHPNADAVVLEVDELHVPAIADTLDADVLVLLNLSRDQLDRVGEITKIERTLRACVAARPHMRIIANCDDVQVTSVAWDAPHVTWVAAGAGWVGDSTSCPRTGGHIIRSGEDWRSSKRLPDGREFRRPTPTWSLSDAGIVDPDGTAHPLTLRLPGRANRGNATQALVGALELTGSASISEATAAMAEVGDVAGRYSTIHYRGRAVRLMLAKNPAGWQEALSMVDRSADSVVIAVNGQVADGQDLSWIWDVRFENFDSMTVIATGERGTDLAVRLGYAGVGHDLIHDMIAAIDACPPGRVEVLANYTAFRDLKRALDRATDTQEDPQ